MSLTEDKIREVLYSVLKQKIPCISDVKIRPISSLNGFTSSLYEATIVTPDEKVEVFAKVTSLASKEVGNCLFNNETFVYASLSKMYNEIQDKHGLTENRFVFPKHYGSLTKDGIQIVVVENLVDRGYECRNRLQCIDWKYASKCVESLARYHALSLAISKEYPKEFKKAGEELKFPDLSSPDWRTFTNRALSVLDESDREKLTELLEGSEVWIKCAEMIKPRKTSVLIHGDYRSSNIMHREVEEELHVIPIDYQTSRLGCPVADLIYFIVMGSDKEFRRQHFQQLVDYYYNELAVGMKSFGLEPEEVYGREEFDSDMKIKLPLGLCTATMVLPFVTVDSADVPSTVGGHFMPRISELFAERFRGLVQDFKRWRFI